MAVEQRPVSACKRTRLDQDLRLVDVAAKAQISAGYLSMVESGYVPKAAVRDRIAAALGCSERRIWPGL